MPRILLPLVIFLLAVPAYDAFSATAFTPKFSIYADDKDNGLNGPEGVACMGGAIVVADSGNGRLVSYSYENSSLKGGKEIRLPQLPYPVRVQFSSKGDIIVLDGKLHKVGRVSAAGEFMGYIEPKGLPFPGTPIPVSFRLDAKDNVYLLDIFSGKVLILDPAGNFTSQAALPDSGFFSDIQLDKSGNIFLLDSVNAMVYTTGKEKNTFVLFTKGLKEYMSFPMYMTFDDRGTLYVVDQNGSGIIIIGQDGSFLGRQLSMGWSEGLLYYPAQACVMPQGEVVVADRGNNRVQVFSISR